MHALEEPSHILWLDIRRNAMTEVCDPATTGLVETGTDARDLLFDTLATAVQDGRVKVSLEVQSLAEEFTCFYGIETGIKTDRVVPDRILLQERERRRRVHALGEECHRYGWVAEVREDMADLAGDVDEGRESKLFKLVGSELACPRVEDLEHLMLVVLLQSASSRHTHLSTSKDLSDKQIRADIGNTVQKRL